MMEFVMLTLSFMVAMLLSSALSVVIVLNTPVMKWYLKRVSKMTMDIMENADDIY